MQISGVTLSLVWALPKEIRLPRTELGRRLRWLGQLEAGPGSAQGLWASWKAAVSLLSCNPDNSNSYWHILPPARAKPALAIRQWLADEVRALQQGFCRLRAPLTTALEETLHPSTQAGSPATHRESTGTLFSRECSRQPALSLPRVTAPLSAPAAATLHH